MLSGKLKLLIQSRVEILGGFIKGLLYFQNIKFMKRFLLCLGKTTSAYQHTFASTFRFPLNGQKQLLSLMLINDSVI